MMTKNILKGLALTALLLPLATGCGEESVLAGGDTGRMALDVDFKSEPLTGKTETASGRATADKVVTTDDLALRLTGLTNDFEETTWESVSAFDVTKEFPVGTYKVEAYYGTETDEGYDMPYYYGSDEIKVLTGKTTGVNLNVTLANSIIKVVYTDAFKEYLSDYSCTLHSEGGQYLSYDETRPEELYIRPGEVTLDVTATLPNGKGGTFEAARFTAKPRYRHTVTLDVNGGETGKGILVVKFDDTMKETKDVEIDLSGDIFSSSAPVLTPFGFTPGETISVVEGTKAPKELSMKAVVRGKIESVMLTTASEALIAAGWPAEVDLVNPGESVKSKLMELGLNTLGIWNKADEMGVIDFTGVASKIPYKEGGDNLSKFTVVVKDRQGKVTEPVELAINVEQLHLILTEGAIIAPGEAQLTVDYNGENIDDVTFRGKNTRNTWTNFVVKSNGKNEATGMYTVVLTFDAKDFSETGSIELLASANGIETQTIIKAPSMVIDSESINAFAKRSFVSVQFTDEAVAAQSNDVKFEVSTNGTDFTAVGGQVRTRASRAVVKTVTYEVTGLQPSTEYMIRSVLGEEKSLTAKFTTEEATALGRNDNCETAPTVNGSESRWQNLTFSDGWGTNNAMTTSQGGNFAYTRISGTIQSEDAKSGKAIVLRTCGWGSGNSAVGTMSGKCKYIDAGLYHLGATRATRPTGFSSVSGPLDTSDLDCGVAFSTRPSALSFQYKYTAKNAADHGEALIRILDESGNVIAETKENLSAQGQYVNKTVNLDYAPDAPKAAKIYVRFLSTNVETALTKNSDWLTPPPFGGNLGKGTYMGSQLYIDDIELIY